ncbi:MAG: TetR/AcrR family transcriptional regulator [Solirubrobacterales bacterium]
MPPARERIIDAAIARVAMDGYEGATVERIIAAAEATPAEFWRSFRSKEHLCKQAFEEICERFDRHLLPIYMNPQPWRYRMRAVAYAATRYCCEHPVEIDFGIVEVSRDPHSPLGERSLRLHLGEIDSVRSEVPDPDKAPSSAAELVVGSFLQLVMRSHAAGSYDGMEAAAPELLYRANELYLGIEAAEEELLIAQQRLGKHAPGQPRTTL